jgi:rubrerythrin
MECEMLYWLKRIISLNMTGGSLEIRTPQDLIQALAKAKRIEEAFEEVLHWQGFLTIQDPETGKLLGTLVRDSETHERLVSSLMHIVEPFAPIKPQMAGSPIVFDGDDEVQFLRKLLEGEDLAYFMYSTILDALAHLDQNTLGGEKNLAEMRRILGQLVSAERRHREIVSQLLADRNPA